MFQTDGGRGDSVPHSAGACFRLTVDGVTQYLLVLSYCPTGTLMDYLKHNALSWQLMCRMCLSLSRGLAHLHSDLRRGGQSLKVTWLKVTLGRKISRITMMIVYL